jgi:hypothetical protein
VATWDDVARLALKLPETEESTSYGNVAWKVRGKGFVWERPLGKSDLKALGDAAPPPGPILGAYVEDLGEKEAVLAEDDAALFTIPHFDGFPAVLVLLDRIDLDRLEEIITEAWMVRAPKRLAQEFLASRSTEK